VETRNNEIILSFAYHVFLGYNDKSYYDIGLAAMKHIVLETRGLHFPVQLVKFLPFFC
jgi:hypothetical protein